MWEEPQRPDCRGIKAAPRFYGVEPSICLRAIGPMYGISQRTPENAFTTVTIKTTRNATPTNAQTIHKMIEKNRPIAGMGVRIAWATE